MDRGIHFLATLLLVNTKLLRESMSPNFLRAERRRQGNERDLAFPIFILPQDLADAGE